MSATSFSLDHIVIAVADLAATIRDYTALGFTVLTGGEHPGRGSRNALVIFADGAYFELIAFTRPVPDFRWWNVLQRDGEGFVDFALLPGDVDLAVKAARGRGLAMGDPEDGGRQRPDGVSVAWRNARPDASDLPFLCYDVTPRGLRVQEGEARRHANGIMGVARIDIAVHDAAESAGRYAALLGGQAATAGRDEQGRDVAVLTVGSATLRLVGAGPQGAASAALRERLSARGEGPLALVMRGERAVALDPALLHGAGITVTGPA